MPLWLQTSKNIMTTFESKPLSLIHIQMCIRDSFRTGSTEPRARRYLSAPRTTVQIWQRPHYSYRGSWQPDSISTAAIPPKVPYEPTSTRCGKRWNGTGSGKMAKTCSTGIGVPTRVGPVSYTHLNINFQANGERSTGNRHSRAYNYTKIVFLNSPPPSSLPVYLSSMSNTPMKNSKSILKGLFIICLLYTSRCV